MELVRNKRKLFNKKEMSKLKDDKYISPEEYEKLQDNFDFKTEYDNGKIIMHSDVSDRHNEITTNLVASLVPFFRKKQCKVRSEKIEIIFDENHKYKPDVFVVCGNPRMKGQSYLTAPKLIFEVISRSTASHDRLTKYNVYMENGVTEYNLVEQNGFITQYTLIDGWYQQTGAFRADDTYKSTAVEGLEIDLNEIFE